MSKVEEHEPKEFDEAKDKDGNNSADEEDEEDMNEDKFAKYVEEAKKELKK